MHLYLLRVGLVYGLLCLNTYTKKENAIKTPADAVIGKIATVEVDINPAQGTGRVRVGGESWKATAEKVLTKGTQCLVVKLNGVTLFVKEK